MTMRTTRWIRLALLTVGAAAVFLAGIDAATCAELSDDELLAGTEARIEKRRKADAVVSVVNAAGKPVPGPRSRSDRRAMRFCSARTSSTGASSTTRSSRPPIAAVRRLLNYATLPFYWPMYAGRRGEPNTSTPRKWPMVQRAAASHQGASAGLELCRSPLAARRLQEIVQAEMSQRIDDCVWRFAGLIDRWDVVNEATHYDRDEFLAGRRERMGMWKEVRADGITGSVSPTPATPSPQATLVINDYRTDPA